MRPSLTTLALLSFASLPQEAAADAPAPTPAVDGRGLTALPGSVASDAPWRVAALPSTDGPSWSVVSTTEWSRRPLAQAHADGTHGVVLEELLVEELGLGWRPLPRLTIAALMPWAAMAEGPSSQRVVGVAGDLRLGAQVALWNTGGAGGPTVGVQPWAALPTGAPGVSLGTGEVSYGAAALVAQNLGAVRLDGELGLGRGVVSELSTTPSALDWRGGLAATAPVGSELHLGVELLTQGAPGSPELMRAEGGTFGRARLPGGFHASLGGALGLGRGMTVGARRVAVGVGWTGGATAEDRPRSVAEATPRQSRSRQPSLHLELRHLGQPVPEATVEVRTSEGRQRVQLTGGTGVIPVTAGTAFAVQVEAGPCLAGTRKGLADRDGAQVRVDLMPARRGVMRFVVSDEVGRTVPHATVRLEGGDPSCRPEGALQLDANGTGGWTVGAGHYTVVVTAPGHKPWRLEQAVEADSTIVLEPRLEPAVDLGA